MPSSSDLRGLPVLVVDDDALSAKLFDAVLRAEGCRVRRAASAEEARPMLASFAPRVVVLDLLLPMMSGLLFAHLLKAAPETRDLVLVAVTALNGTQIEAVAREAGFAAVLRKPIDPTHFVNVLIELVRGLP